MNLTALSPWLPVATLASLVLYRLLTSKTPPTWLVLPNPYRAILAGIVGAAAAILGARASGATWPAAVTQALLALAGAGGLHLVLPEPEEGR